MTEARNSSDWSYPLGLFQGFGVELEYMIVDQKSLDVRPVADRLFEAALGASASDVPPVDAESCVSWCNELVLHVVEFKTDGPAENLEGLLHHFHREISRAAGHLESLGCMLLPTGMHPWMDPQNEAVIWPHEYTEVYRTYDQIFGCKSHGYANLQSTHLNLPFANNAEFGRLHAAIRLVLPLLPALAASSPFIEGRASTLLDHRLEVYRKNAARVPLMAGDIIPEPIADRQAYEQGILEALYAQLAPLDPAGHLRHEFANSRGAIARFDRGAIEIRLLDLQECPAQDLSILALIVAIVKALCEERWQPMEVQLAVPTLALKDLLLRAIQEGENALVDDARILAAFGQGPRPTSLRGFLEGLLEAVLPSHPLWTPRLEKLLRKGCLATRLRRALRGVPTREGLHEVYSELAVCLREGRAFGLD